MYGYAPAVDTRRRYPAQGYGHPVCGVTGNDKCSAVNHFLNKTHIHTYRVIQQTETFKSWGFNMMFNGEVNESDLYRGRIEPF